VSADAAKALKTAKPDVVVLCTSSSIKTVLPQIETILKAKVPIVSTTEELSYPGYTHIRQARLIHAMAKKAKVAVLGTGVNPGFAMDALPIALSAVCERVDRVVVQRVQDARIRRLPFQQKIGAGLTTEQFQKKVDDGSVRHVGLTESIAMIADAMGWTLDRITDEIQPKLATVTKSLREAQLPPEYKATLSAAQITRGDLAALIGVRLESVVKAAPTRQVVMTDVRGHWAATWIARVAEAGIMPPFENHTFQPNAVVRRGDLAVAISRLLTQLSSNDAALRSRLAQRPAIGDMNRRHVQYTAAAAAVASGVMPLVEGDRFLVGRPVSGSEAVETLDKVSALSAQTASAGL